MTASNCNISVATQLLLIDRDTKSIVSQSVLELIGIDHSNWSRPMIWCFMENRLTWQNLDATRRSACL